MTRTDSDSSAKSKPSVIIPALTSIVLLVFVLALMAVSMFWPAGTLDWPRGWTYCVVYLVMILGSIAWVMATNPELFVVRQKFQKGTRGWDAIVASLTVLIYFIVPPVAALDAVRFGWTPPAPDWLVILGYVLLCGGFIGLTWAQSVNRHFEATVRIQTDRDHKVIDTGPYAFIRHPGYSFGVIHGAGIALALGSLVALIPVALLVPLLAGRTLGEEGVLHKGLPGYTEYTKRVRWRWVPLIW